MKRFFTPLVIVAACMFAYAPIMIAQAPTTPPDSAPPPGNTPPPGSAPPTARPPRISAASLTHKRFRIPSQATSSATARQRAPTGTRLRFTLSATARLQIAITWATGAVRRGRGCVAPTRALERRHAGRCVRTLTVGSLIRAREPAGADGVAFSGRIGRRALRPGSYKATLRASNAAGRSRPVALSFAVVR